MMYAAGGVMAVDEAGSARRETRRVRLAFFRVLVIALVRFQPIRSDFRYCLLETCMN